MNRIFFLSVLVFLFIVQAAFAAPMIGNVTVSPSDDLWLGESATISLNCYDSNDIESVYANITGNSIVLPIMNFTNNNGNYTLTVSKDYLDRTGQFDATIYCRNNLSEVNTSVKSFTVSNLTEQISAVTPTPAYIGDTIEIDAIVKKNDARLSSGVSFNVYLNNQLKSLKIMPAYDSNKGWMLKIDSPSTSSIYDLKVFAFYGRTNVTAYSSVDVRSSVEFNIESVDKSWVKSDDNITVTLKAFEKGSLIELNKDNVEIKINSADAQVTSVSKRDNLFDVKVIAPTMSSGSYQLEAYLNYKGSTYSDKEPIDYIVSIEGSIVDSNNKAISTQIKFIQSGVTSLSLVTDAYGHYTGSVPPGTYDIEMAFPKSTLYLYSVLVNSFNDPLRYFYGDDFDVPGIRNAGLYDYELDLSYSDAEIEMSYNEKNVVNEDNLRIFKCSSWNTGKKICNDEWLEINGDIDVIRNKVKVSSTTLSAFILGELKSLSVDFNPDKEEYYIGDNVKIRGIVKDNDGNSVGNASVTVKVKNTQISYNVVADINGVFSVEFPSPEEEGLYIVSVSSKKNPYIDFKGEKSFDVVKKKSVYIDFPETIRIERGNNLTQEFSLVNDGQADVSNIQISLEGLPQSYYSISSNNIDLKSEQSKNLYLEFHIPVYADVGISSGTIKIESGNITEEKVFGLNIVEIGDNSTSPSTGLLTGFTLPEISYSELTYIAIFAVACFSFVIILKKLRVRGNRRNDIKKFLSNVEGYVKSGGHDTDTKKIDDSYDKLIVTEFPNFLKFSKKLTKNKGDEKW
jgi:hypothetical protein